MKKVRISKDKIVSIVFILLSVAILVLTQQVRVLPNLAEPGPRLFPQIAAIGMILCGIGMFFTKDPEAKEETVYLTRDGWKRFAVVIAVMAAYILGLTYIGFLISTPIAMLGFIAVLRSGKPVSKIGSVIIALAVTGILYFTFVKLFVIPLPKGKFF